MLSIGLQPDILICRMDRKMPADERRKIALFCNVEERAIVGSYDVDSIYECPEMLHDQGIDNIITEQLQLNVQQADLTAWKKSSTPSKTRNTPSKSRWSANTLI